jgi:hypothetical protein
LHEVPEGILGDDDDPGAGRNEAGLPQVRLDRSRAPHGELFLQDISEELTPRIPWVVFRSLRAKRNGPARDSSRAFEF